FSSLSEETMRHWLVTALCISGFAAAALADSSSLAQTVYPIDRADILTGSRFDLKVEFETVVDPAQISVTLNGDDLPKTFRSSVRSARGQQGSILSHPARCLARDRRILPRGGERRDEDPPDQLERL